MDLRSAWQTLDLAVAWAVLPMFLLHRWAMVAYVRRSMFARSGQPGLEHAEERRQPQFDAAPPASVRVDDAVAVPEWERDREALARVKRRSLNRRALAGVGAAAGYALLPPLFGLIDGSVDTGRWSVVADAGLFLCVYVGLSYWLNRRLFVPRSGIAWNSMPAQIAIGVRLMRASLSPPWDLAFACVLVLVALESVIGKADPFAWASYSNTGAPGFLTGIFVALALHLCLVVGSWLIRDKTPGPKLLVLRVFGSPKAPALIFDKLAGAWSRYGTYMTIDDPAFARHRYRVFQFGTLVTAFVTLMFAVSSGFLALGVVGLIAARDWFELLRRGPTADGAQTERRIQRVLANPWRLDGRHTDLRMAAYMDVWKVVVGRFAAVADVVLFDLRAYRDTNQGSAWEVGCLFDTFPIERVVFLVSETDDGAVEAMLGRAGHTVWERSPNAAVLPRMIRIVRMSTADPDSSARALLDRLLHVVGAATRTQPA